MLSFSRNSNEPFEPLKPGDLELPVELMDFFVNLYKEVFKDDPGFAKKDGNMLKADIAVALSIYDMMSQAKVNSYEHETSNSGETLLKLC